jgi:hypothetical protein
MSEGDVLNFAEIFELRVEAIGKFCEILMTRVNEEQILNRYGRTPEARVIVGTHPRLFRLAFMMNPEYSSAKLIGLPQEMRTIMSDFQKLLVPVHQLTSN